MDTVVMIIVGTTAVGYLGYLLYQLWRGDMS